MEFSKKLPTKTLARSENLVSLGDCFELLQHESTDSVDLIYIDPPFLTQKRHSLTNRNRTKTFSFDDVWDTYRDYGNFLAERLIQCHRVLKSTGSLFFHCDRNAVHIARVVLDDIFDSKNFRSEIIWTYRRWSNSRRGLLPAHQNILYYTKSEDFTFNREFTEYSPSTNIEQILQQRERDENGKSTYKRNENGNVVSNGPKRGVPMSDVWDIPYLNPKAKERVGYPTQKPILLLERIIKLSTNPGDLVLDPFCGSGTTLVAAKLNNRNYFGIDQSSDACTLAEQRLSNPVKTSSNLHNVGRDSYKKLDQDAITYLHGLSFKPVQRNRGIDAILDDDIDGLPVLVRVQRPNESLRECGAKLLKAAVGKNAAKLIVVRTTNDKPLELFDDFPDSVTVCDAGSYSILEALTKNGR